MDCTEAEKAIVEHGAAVPVTVQEHLAGCPACRQFAALQRLVLAEVAGALPTAALEVRVKSAAHRRLRRGWRLRSRVQAVWLAAAAAVVVLAGSLWVVRVSRPGPPGPSGGAGTVAAAVPPGLHSWAVAQADLMVIEDGLDAALAELGGTGASSRTTNGFGETPEQWDSLMELEFDLYFESQDLRQSGG